MIGEGGKRVEDEEREGENLKEGKKRRGREDLRQTNPKISRYNNLSCNARSACSISRPLSWQYTITMSCKGRIRRRKNTRGDNMVANYVFHATCTGLASFPGSYMQGEPGIYSHVTMTYIIKIGPQFLEQKGNAFALFHQLCFQCSVCMIFATPPLITREV